MSVLVDTTIWSLALRRGSDTLSDTEEKLVAEWRRLISADQGKLIGPIRQEILSGCRTADSYRLEKHLDAFEDVPITPADYIQAAQYYNLCRGTGIAATHVDLLICSVAVRDALPIFTTDMDFYRYSKVIPITLHVAEGAPR